MTDETTEPDGPRERLSTALIQTSSVCNVLARLGEIDGDRALLYLVDQFDKHCCDIRTAYDELFPSGRAAQ